ncbi:MAG: DsbA family protein, partial [SAR324 cluster bacterium]|nr:DsbA family protein [SAR324 cluster bacterium]
KGLMEAEGLPYGERSHTYNSRLAQELGKWADTQPGGNAIHDALFRAYFVETRNIGSTEVLLEVVDKVGLDREQAGRVLGERSFSGAIDEDWQRSMSAGVTGVPTFVAGEFSVVGAQTYETLQTLMEKVGAVPRADAGQAGPPQQSQEETP